MLAKYNGENGMTYETSIGIEIAGIKRSIRLEFNFHVEMVDGERLPIHEGVRILDKGMRASGTWVYDAIGPRQLKELEARLMHYWDGRKTAA